MTKSISNLKSRALEIKQELQEGKNTADKVGGLLYDMIGYDEYHNSALESDMADLQALYVALTQSDIVIVEEDLPVIGQKRTIYRKPDDNVPPGSYSDYMWNGSEYVLMATYTNNNYDDVPMFESPNLVNSGGIHSKLMEYSHNLTNDDIIVGSSVARPVVLKRFVGPFKAGQRCIIKLVDGHTEGSSNRAMTIAIRDGNGNTLTSLHYFDNCVAEYCVTEQLDVLEIATYAKEVTSVGGELYAYISSIDRNYSDSSLFLETPLECYADCVKELYLKDLDSNKDYYLYVRRQQEGHIYVQITKELVPIPVTGDLVAQADFLTTDPDKTIATITPRNDSTVSGTCVLFRESLEGIGSHAFTTKGHKIKKPVVSNINNFPICKLYSEGIDLYFEGLDDDTSYYLRVAVAGTAQTRYIQLSDSADVTPGSLVAQGIVVSSGMQILTSMNESGISGMVYLPTTDEFAPVKIDNSAASGEDSWRIQVAKLWESVSKTYTVKQGESLLACLIEAVKTPNSTVYVEGEHNLFEEFKAYYGDNFFTNYTASSVKGIILQNGVRVIFASTAKVLFNYTGSNQYVMHEFSPFNSGPKGFTLENLRLRASNCRYCVHDERYPSGDQYTNRYINCDLYLDNSNNAFGYPQCIGGGLGFCGEIEVRNCVFESNLSNVPGQEYSIVSWHNAETGQARSTLVISDNYFKGKSGFRLSWHGETTEITKAIVCGNSFGRDIEQTGEGSGARNTEVIAWNNIVR